MTTSCVGGGVACAQCPHARKYVVVSIQHTNATQVPIQRTSKGWGQGGRHAGVRMVKGPTRYSSNTRSVTTHFAFAGKQTVLCTTLVPPHSLVPLCSYVARLFLCTRYSKQAGRMGLTDVVADLCIVPGGQKLFVRGFIAIHLPIPTNQESPCSRHPVTRVVPTCFRHTFATLN